MLVHDLIHIAVVFIDNLIDFVLKSMSIFFFLGLQFLELGCIF